MICTINTDASFSWQYKIGAYAFWIVSNEGRISMSGPFANPVESSQEAEAKCILNAIHVVLKQSYHKKISVIVINTDSATAISIFKKKSKLRETKWMASHGLELRKQFLLFKQKLNCKIVLRKVVAHKKVTDAKGWVNDWCDKNAKEQLWKQISEKKRES